MKEYFYLFIHHDESFLENELNIYEGTIYELKIDVIKWSYFELVDIVKEIGYKEINIILYKDSTFGMHVLVNDKGALDIAYHCKMHLSVHIYIQHLLSQFKSYDDPLEEEELNLEDIVNLEEEEYFLSKLYEVVREDCEVHGGDVHDGKGQDDEVQDDDAQNGEG